MRVILVTGYFGIDVQEGKLNYFARLDKSLRAKGLSLYLLGLSGHPIPAPLRGSSVPRLIEKSHWLPLDRIIRPKAVAPEIQFGAEIDAVCWNRSPSRERLRVLLFREHIREIVKHERPALVIAWHQFFGVHYGLDSLFAGSGIPWRYAEFGPLPGTILFDADGQGAESPIVARCSEFLAQNVDAIDRARAAAFITKVRTEKRTRKPQAASGTVKDALSAAGRPGMPVIFYAGQYDCRTGMVPRTLPKANLHSPMYSSTIDALSHLSALAERNDWLILFKPHPLSMTSEAELREIAAPDRVVTVPGANIFECLESAQVVTTIVSQVSYMGLIWERPCVMLGRSYLSGKGCVAEPDSLDAVEPAIRATLELGFTEFARNAWQKHVAQLLKYSVYAFDEDFSAEGLRGLDETATFLESVCAAAPEAPEPAISSLQSDVGGDSRAAAALRRLYGIFGYF